MEPKLGQLVGAILCFSLSLAPSLLPRSWHVQGIVSGFAATIGYALGGGISKISSRIFRKVPALRGKRFLSFTLLVFGIAVPLWWLVANFQWQVDVRRRMGMENSIAWYPFAITISALIAAYVLVVAGRTIREAYIAFAGFITRFVPDRWKMAAKVMVTVLVVGVFLDVVVGEQVVGGFNNAYVSADARFDAGVDPPNSAFRSGAGESLIPWDALGRQGRRFVAGGPSTDELERSNGAPSLDPIRVYAGLATSTSLAERAEVAVAELERTGAFRRQALVVIIPTGTGWVDPQGIDPLEYMFNGDTASVALQYSYLPSWAFMMIGRPDIATQAGKSLFEAVRRRWEQEPESERPLLLLYGESLGVFGSESVFRDLQEIRQRTDGVLWVGPPRFSRLWRHFTNERDPGSPVWQPVHQAGVTVRFGRDGRSLSQPSGPWEQPRVVYLQHGSDPITWWTPDLLFNRPEWMDEPRSPDVSEKLFYVPVATFLQTTLDLIVSTDVPFGHGHSFGQGQAEAWLLIAHPDGSRGR